MITSASMGIAVGDNPYLIKTVIKQIIFYWWIYSNGIYG